MHPIICEEASFDRILPQFNICSDFTHSLNAQYIVIDTIPSFLCDLDCLDFANERVRVTEKKLVRRITTRRYLNQTCPAALLGTPPLGFRPNGDFAPFNQAAFATWIGVGSENLLEQLFGVDIGFSWSSSRLSRIDHWAAV